MDDGRLKITKDATKNQGIEEEGDDDYETDSGGDSMDGEDSTVSQRRQKSMGVFDLDGSTKG